MNHDFEIKCVESDTFLKFIKLEQDYYNVHFSEKGFSGQVKAYDNHWKGLPMLFEELAVHWKGWKGENTWQSLEGDVSISASSTALGEIALKIALRRNDGETWETKGAISLGAGSLESVYLAAQRTFQ